ncbi:MULTISPECIES: exosortase A [unclassified Marinobacter]|jgi:EpsI family protein|uniref:exosortase A n=1 Tax=unclassified Marinobacter TaxID=83889 RepID=UPI00130EBCF1|nr:MULTISPECIES: exosortase A [unclassified Marinobacter]
MIAVVFLTLALWKEWETFFSLWIDSLIYNHGFIVFAGTLFLLFKRKESLSQLQPVGSALGLFFLLGSIPALVLAQTADIRVIQLFLIPFIILFWGWSIWGIQFAKTAGGPIMLLLFATPFWDDFSPALQHITVFFNGLLLSLTNIPAEIKEFYIILEVGTFLVEGGCSGVRYLIVGIFLATFYGQLFYNSHRRTVFLVVIAALLSMLANWLRVFGIIAAGHYTEMQTSLVEDHELFGWGVFIVIALIPTLLIAAKLEGKALAHRYITPGNNISARNSRNYLYLTLASALLLMPAIIPLALSGPMKDTGSDWRPSLFALSDGWKGPLKHAEFWHPAFKRPDIELSGVYVSEDLQRIQAQLVGYRQQDQGKELIYYANSLFDPTEWHLLSQSNTPVQENLIPGLNAVTETVIQNRLSGLPVIIWSWYQLGDFRGVSPSMVKLVGALKQITGDGRGALWAVAAQCDASGGGDVDCGPQRNHLIHFLGDIERYP